MVMRDRSNLLKHLLVMGTAGASLLVGLPALSQTSSESTAPGEIVMSAEGMKILCEVFPLNSRCSGGEQPTAVPSISEPRESVNPPTSLEPQTTPNLSPQPSAPGETTPPSIEPSAPEPSDSMDSGGKPSGSMAPSSAPDTTTPVPAAPKPQSSTAPGTNPTETTAPSVTPDYLPSKAGTSTKGEADALRTEVPASAQTPAAPGAAPTRTPRSPASPQTPGATPASPQAPSVAPTTGTPAAAVSPTELQKFAEVIPQLQEIQNSAQQQVSEAIKKAGLSEDRFRELYGAQQPSAATQASTPATPQEQQAVQQVVSQLETIQSETQTRRVQAVQSQGLELNRFNEILTAVRQDSDLQQQLQQILSN